MLDIQTSAGAQARKPTITADYALAALRVGAIRTRLLVAEADTIGVALRDGWVSPEGAMLWARDCGVLDLVGDQDIKAGTSEDFADIEWMTA
jgi:hypothetical protein